MSQEFITAYRGPRDGIHNHPPTVPACPEKWVDGALVGACLIQPVRPDGGAA